MPTQKYTAPSWQETYSMLMCQAKKIDQAHFKPDLIVAVLRGGLVPARVLSDLLTVNEIGVLGVTFYVGVNKTRDQPAFTQGLSLPVAAKRVLLVDDVADTGQSLKLAAQQVQLQGVQELKTATLYLKPTNGFTPDFFERITSSWIIFPWDTKETIQKIKAQSKSQLKAEVSGLVEAGLSKQLIKQFLAEQERAS